MKRGLGIALLALVAGITGLHAAAPRAGAVAAGLTITKVVSGSNVTTPGGHINYTITVSNPTVSSISLDCVIDSLPTMFTYQTGSTSGGPGSPGEPDPTNCLSFGTGTAWFFDSQYIGAGNSISWSFTADVSTDESAGCFYNDATAYFNQTSSDTGLTAPVLVTASEGACGQQTPPAIVKSATPTFTATPVATNTSEPTKVPPTATIAPPTSTPTLPGGGAAGAISAPNTGDGSASTRHGAASRSMAVLLSLAMAGGLLATGAGVAARRSR